jgi:hypothetical protein
MSLEKIRTQMFQPSGAVMKNRSASLARTLIALCSTAVAEKVGDVRLARA